MSDNQNTRLIPDIPDSDITPSKGNYVPTGAFRFWAQKVLPTVYDDSLSYYEVLTKLVQFINQISENADVLNDAVDSTISSFGDLQDYVNSTYNLLEDYVNNYFENLDIQSEINRKLDIMAADGSLTALLRPIIPSIITDWLDENIEPTTPAIDASLTVSGAGADAKVTGDIRYILENASGTYKVKQWTSGYRALSDPLTLASSENWVCVAILAPEGKVFYVKGSGGTDSQLWFFCTQDGTPLTSSGSNTREANYVKVTAPPRSYYFIANSRITELPDYEWGCIVGEYLTDYTHREVTNIISKPLKKYTQEGFDVSEFVSDAGSSDWFWFNNETYPAGYIDQFVVYGTSGSIGKTGYVCAQDSVTNKLLWVSEPVVANTTTLNFNCKKYFPNPVYIGVRLQHVAHASVGNDVKYANMWHQAVWKEGAVFPIDWNDADVKFKFAIECYYGTYADRDSLTYANEVNKMYVAGDSITAGYPYTYGISAPHYYDPDIKFGNAIARKLGFKVTLGTQTGAGWIYQPSAGADYAISLANDTNFANYDSVIFAFGTNDYGNNIPLGSNNDIYPTDETVCGAINYVINKIYTDNPSAIVILSGPINRKDKGDADSNFAFGTENSAGYTLLELSEKIKELCNLHGVYFLDNVISPFNKHTMATLLVDNLHPTAAGYQKLASHICAKVGEVYAPYKLSVQTVEHYLM